MKFRFTTKTPENQLIEYHLTGFTKIRRWKKIFNLSKKLIKDGIPHFISYTDRLSNDTIACLIENMDDKKNKWGIKIFIDDTEEGLHEHYDLVITKKVTVGG